MKVVLATNNRHKVLEFRGAQAFSDRGIELITAAEAGFCGEIAENADSFEGNALIKARALCEFTGKISIADDSGLIVDRLNGAPGIYSARYAGEHATDAMNNALLLKNLCGVPYAERTARFVCTICVCRPDGQTLFVTGQSEGIILDAPRGENDFGYDPLFYFPPLGKTFAELGRAEKEKVSHRGSAIRALCGRMDFITDG